MDSLVPAPTTSLAKRVNQTLGLSMLPKSRGTAAMLEYQRFPQMKMTEQNMAMGRMRPSLSPARPASGEKITLCVCEREREREREVGRPVSQILNKQTTTTKIDQLVLLSFVSPPSPVRMRLPPPRSHTPRRSRWGRAWGQENMGGGDEHPTNIGTARAAPT